MRRSDYPSYFGHCGYGKVLGRLAFLETNYGISIGHWESKCRESLGVQPEPIRYSPCPGAPSAFANLKQVNGTTLVIYCARSTVRLLGASDLLVIMLASRKLRNKQANTTLVLHRLLNPFNPLPGIGPASAGGSVRNASHLAPWVV